MINSRDSYTDFNPNKKESIEVPYGIGTIVELRDNPDVLAKICQYRIIVEQFRLEIYVGLNTSIYEKESEILKIAKEASYVEKFKDKIT